MAHALELEAIDQFTCPTCNEPQGLACVTPGGRRREPHESRLRLADRRRKELEKLATWQGGSHGALPGR